MLNHYLSGPTEEQKAGNALGTAFSEILQGSSDPDSPEAQARAKFYGNALGIAGRQVLDSEEGQAALNKAFAQIVLPLTLLAFVAGWYFAKRKQ
jgi:hypothetical protein